LELPDLLEEPDLVIRDPRDLKDLPCMDLPVFREMTDLLDREVFVDIREIKEISDTKDIPVSDFREVRV
jgi:hypothetical protein